MLRRRAEQIPRLRYSECNKLRSSFRSTPDRGGFTEREKIDGTALHGKKTDANRWVGGLKTAQIKERIEELIASEKTWEAGGNWTTVL